MQLEKEKTLELEKLRQQAEFDKAVRMEQIRQQMGKSETGLGNFKTEFTKRWKIVWRINN